MENKRIITAKYYIADCEHIGDIQYSINYVKKIHPKINIINSYWDRYDCGEAYVEFSFPSIIFKQVYNILGGYPSCSYDADINDYVKQDTNFLHGATFLSRAAYFTKQKEYRTYYGNDLKENIPLHLFFATDRLDNDKEKIKQVIQEICNTLDKGTKILYYSFSIVDDLHYIDILLTTHIDNVISQKFNHIGDYCLGGGYTILSKYRLYGECSPIHELFRSRLEYDKFREKIYKWCKEHDIK